LKPSFQQLQFLEKLCETEESLGILIHRGRTWTQSPARSQQTGGETEIIFRLIFPPRRRWISVHLHYDRDRNLWIHKFHSSSCHPSR
jgi:hypothetical protein